MEPLGIILYGYGREHAERILSTLAKVVKRELLLISASGFEGKTIHNVLEAGEADFFEEKEDRFLMLLGFSQEEASRALKGFPGDGGIVRPIFCGLTEENLNWEIIYLLDHLKEEKAYWDKKKREDAQ